MQCYGRSKLHQEIRHTILLLVAQNGAGEISTHVPVQAQMGDNYLEYFVDAHLYHGEEKKTKLTRRCFLEMQPTLAQVPWRGGLLQAPEMTLICVFLLFFGCWGDHHCAEL